MPQPRASLALRRSPPLPRSAQWRAARRAPPPPAAAAADEVPAEYADAWRECTEQVGASPRAPHGVFASAPHAPRLTARAQVCALGFTADEAELMVRKALAWGFKGYWRTEKVREAPSPAAQAARLAYLREELALDDDALRKVLKAFPEALGLDVKQRMLPNVVRLRSHACYSSCPG